MKRLQLIFLIGLLVSEISGQSLTFMTYNIRLENSGDGKNNWPLRKAWLCKQISTANPDVFGIQEGLPQQVAYIDSSFKDYRHIGVGREDGKAKGEFSAIWYNTRKFMVIKKGTFWLSETPEKVSVGWDAALERICTYGLFRVNATGRRFWVFNTHFDHMGVEARKNSAILILEKISTLNKAGFPVILMGDLNTPANSEPIQLLSAKFQDAKTADKSMNMLPDGTFNGFDDKKAATERIDFIFCGYGASAINYQVIRETHDGLFASDHYPVVAEINYSVK